MVLEQFPLRELTTAAGVAAAALAIRQVIEASKGSFFPWLDAGNERKGAILLAAVIYLAWLAIYGKDLATDGPAALAAFFACATAAMGANEAVDAAKGVVAKNVASQGTDPAVQAAAANATSQGGADVVGAAAATSGVDPDGGVAAEEPPGVDLSVNAGDPLDDEDEDSIEDPAGGSV